MKNEKEKLRDRFLSECTDRKKNGVLRIKMLPFELFEWFFINSTNRDFTQTNAIILQKKERLESKKTDLIITKLNMQMQISCYHSREDKGDKKWNNEWLIKANSALKAKKVQITYTQDKLNRLKSFEKIERIKLSNSFDRECNYNLRLLLKELIGIDKLNELTNKSDLISEISFQRKLELELSKAK